MQCSSPAMSSRSTLRSTASSASISWVRALPRWHRIGADCGSWRSSTSRSPSFRPMSSSRGGTCHMARGKYIAIAALILSGVLGFYFLWRAEATTPIMGVVRTTEIRIAPEIAGQLADIKVDLGGRVRAGGIVAELSAVELTAAVAQARAQLAAAKASRDHVYAGVRAEQVASLAAEIAKAKARLDYAQAQLTRVSTLAGEDFAAKQALDQATNDVANARSDVADAEANHQAAVAGPTREERAIADAEVEAAASALAVLERRLDKTILRAPADGVVSVIVAEIGENIRAGQPVLVIAETGKQFLSFNAREDLLRGLTVGASVNVRRSGAAEKTLALVTELRPLGTFATWQAERAVGDHDRNTLRLRLDLRGDPTGFEPGMTVWISR